MVHVMHMLAMFFAVVKLFEIIIFRRQHASTCLRHFIENSTRMVCIIPLNTKNEDQTLR